MLRIFNKLCFRFNKLFARVNKFKEVPVLINYVAEFLSLIGYGLTLQILSGPNTPNIPKILEEEASHWG